VTNSTGVTTGFSWSGCGMIRQNTIPVATCTGNSGN
jgi:hypothetical protein